MSFSTSNNSNCRSRISTQEKASSLNNLKIAVSYPDILGVCQLGLLPRFISRGRRGLRKSNAPPPQFPDRPPAFLCSEERTRGLSPQLRELRGDEITVLKASRLYKGMPFSTFSSPRSSMSTFLSTLSYHVFTIFLFSKSDIKTTLIPVVGRSSQFTCQRNRI